MSEAYKAGLKDKDIIKIANDIAERSRMVDSGLSILNDAFLFLAPNMIKEVTKGEALAGCVDAIVSAFKDNLSTAPSDIGVVYGKKWQRAVVKVAPRNSSAFFVATEYEHIRYIPTVTIVKPSGGVAVLLEGHVKNGIYSVESKIKTNHELVEDAVSSYFGKPPGGRLTTPSGGTFRYYAPVYYTAVLNNGYYYK